MKKKYPYARLGKTTAILTFVIATVLVALYFFTGDLGYGFIGYFFFLFAALANTLILILILIKTAKVDRSERKNRGIGLMLLNIPVALLYFGIGFYFTDVMRITIENNTGKDMTYVQITGCENKDLDRLRNGDSKTVWISVNGDCSIEMNYQDFEGKTRNETIIGYVTTGMGQKYTYSMGKGEVGW